MDEFIPKDIQELIERVEAKQDEAYRAQKRAREAEREREDRIEALRQAREDELIAACHRIDVWIEYFNDTAGVTIWSLLGSESSLVLFSGKFWNGEPAPEGDVACSAQLRLGGPDAGLTRRLVYEESYKGRLSMKLPLLNARTLWQRLHPDFVLQCDAHLAGPDAWKYIRQRLQQLEASSLPPKPSSDRR